MKSRMITALFVFSCFIGTNALAANAVSTTTKPAAPKGCKPNCDGIPAGKCSCVSIDHYTCCGLRTDSLTTKDKNDD